MAKKKADGSGMVWLGLGALAIYLYSRRHNVADHVNTVTLGNSIAADAILGAAMTGGITATTGGTPDRRYLGPPIRVDAYRPGDQITLSRGQTPPQVPAYYYWGRAIVGNPMAEDESSNVTWTLFEYVYNGSGKGTIDPREVY